jgi:L-ascorbate metabolism protein UlaG (beta-lactamase superfamily)
MRIFCHRAATIALTCAILAAPAAAQGPWDVPTLPASQVASGRVAVRFMGTTTLLLDDGTTQILIDGFFTRPSAPRVLALRIAPDGAVIDSAMARAGIGNRLRAVLVAHSHYDHALDAPIVAQRTGARLVGSASTANIGRGAGLPDSQIDIVRDRQQLDYGDFHVTVFRSPHSPDMQFPGEITAPLTPPAPAEDYREGGSYSFLVSHRGFSILIHPSANVSPRLYQGVRAQVVFLGIGKLGSQADRFVGTYWAEVVRTTGARLVIPIHWDNFTRPLDDGLQLPPRWVDDVPSAIRTLRHIAVRTRVRLRAMPLFDAVDIEARALRRFARTPIPPPACSGAGGSSEGRCARSARTGFRGSRCGIPRSPGCSRTIRG